MPATSAGPALSSGPSFSALIEMGAEAGEVLGAPISTKLIIVEMTAASALTIAVMKAVVTAPVMVQQTQACPYSSGSWASPA